VQGGGRLEDPAAVGPGDPGVVGHQGGRRVAHDHHPAVFDLLGPQDGVVDHLGHLGQHSRGPELGRPAVVVAGPHDPVAPGPDVLDHQGLAPGQDHPLQQAPRAAVGRGQRLSPDDVDQQ
jgi:hypothetical protein